MKIVDRNGEKVQEYVEMEPVIIYKGSLRGSDQVFHVTILVAALSALMGRIEEVGHVMLSAWFASVQLTNTRTHTFHMQHCHKCNGSRAS